MKRKLQITRIKKFIWLLLLLACHLSLAAFVFADEISSKSALVMEASTGRILFAKNPNLKLPPASTAKLAAAMIVLDKAQMNDTVVISKKAAKVPSTNGTKFKAGETMTIETLLYAALLKSVNGAAYALAEYVAGSEKDFVELMNKKVISIGAADTRFINTTGLPGRGQWTTAYDLAKIMRYSLKYPMLKEIIGTRAAEISTEEGRLLSLENTNKLLWSGNGAIGGKTGYTKAARHCFVYAGEKEGETVIVAILGAPSRDMLWSEAERLTQKGFEVIANNDQPVVYFTKADYEKKSTSKGKNTKTRKSSKNNKTKLSKAASKKKSKKLEAEKKDVKSPAEQSKRKKNMLIARSHKNGIQG